MVNEKRLIYADAFFKEADKALFMGFRAEERKRNFLDMISAMLDNCPTVDAVEVVRCKDCKHMSECRGETLCDNPMGIFGRNTADDFCSHGERREGE